MSEREKVEEWEVMNQYFYSHISSFNANLSRNLFQTMDILFILMLQMNLFHELIGSPFIKWWNLSYSSRKVAIDV